MSSGWVRSSSRVSGLKEGGGELGGGNRGREEGKGGGGHTFIVELFEMVDFIFVFVVAVVAWS